MSIHVHATCVAIDGYGVLIRGAPGSGKSELALRLIDAPGFGIGDTLLRTMLVADDQTALELRADGIWASAPAVIAGLLELRGRGILTVPIVASAKLALVVDLVPSAEINRMPEPHELETEILGQKLPRIALDRTQPAAPALVRASLVDLLNQLPSPSGTS